MYTIETMTIADYDDVIALWQRTAGMSLELEDVDSRAQIARYLQRNPDMSFVARAGGCLAGAVLCGHDGRRGYLNHLAVDAAFRCRGIGSALVARCLSALAHDGIARCNIFVMAENMDGRRFWERRGWMPKPNPRLQTATHPPAGVDHAGAGAGSCRPRCG